MRKLDISERKEKCCKYCAFVKRRKRELFCMKTDCDISEDEIKNFVESCNKEINYKW